MNKKQAILDQMIARYLLTYVTSVWPGEAVRDVINRDISVSQIADALLDKTLVDTKGHAKWLLYSGLFVLLKQKLRLSRGEFSQSFRPRQLLSLPSSTVISDLLSEPLILKYYENFNYLYLSFVIQTTPSPILY